MKEITLLIVDDHPLFRQGVADALALEEGFRVVGQAADGKHALELIRDLDPDIAVLDVNLPEMNGQQITHQVTQEKLRTRILLLTGYDDIEQAIHAAHAGAAAYCAKDIQPQSLIGVIREVAKGKFVVGENVFTRRELDNWLESQMEGARRSYSEPGSPFHPLSDREMEVLSCVVRGMSNKEIAIELGVGLSTVKSHVNNIFSKLNISSRKEAMDYK